MDDEYIGENYQGDKSQGKKVVVLPMEEWKKSIERLRLYVAGEGTGNPDDWSQWSEYSLLLAASVEQAETMTWKRPIAEVDMSKPAVLVSLTEGNWGEDL